MVANPSQFVASEHPVLVTEKIKELYGRDVVFEFSRYTYKPQSLEDVRKVFLVHGKDITPSNIEVLLSSLEDGQELALHSRVRFPNKRQMHIPMIDFIKQHLDGDNAQLLAGLVDKEILRSLFFFNSGRSLHGYSLHLITRKKWVSFMGTLLLLNLPKHNETVDPRWIGHRLRAGYGALRWSLNTSHYLAFPKKVSEPIRGFSKSDILKWIEPVSNL